jgi:N-acetylmuramoyl-L-alanine amidase
MSQIISFPSPNFDDRPQGIPTDILVVHYTGMSETIQALERMCSPLAKVSAHYLIDEKGQVFQLVSEKKRAWHAGISSWRGNFNINDRSIGIELSNPGHEFSYQKFPKTQINSFINLANNIIRRHSIPARNIVGHSDISPTRKKDPGELFEWRKLALRGIGYWPKTLKRNHTRQVNKKNFEFALKTYGYETSNLQATIIAFQRHFLPRRINGIADQEMYTILEVLINNL